MADGARVIPRRCRTGEHELIARTTLLTRTSWDCARCVRARCYRAHHGVDIPPEMLDERCFRRPPEMQHNTTLRKTQWVLRVEFESGWSYADPDPTPELREKCRAAEASKRRAQEQRERAERMAADKRAEAEDRASRRAANRLAAERSTAEIQRMMEAFRAS